MLGVVGEKSPARNGRKRRSKCSEWPERQIEGQEQDWGEESESQKSGKAAI